VSGPATPTPDRSLRGAGERRAPSPGRVFAVGLLLSVLLGVASRRPALRRERRLFEEEAAQRGNHIARELVTPLEAALSVAVMFEASGEVTAAEFATFAARTMRRHDSIAAIAWAPRVVAADRQAFVARQRRRMPEFRLLEPGPGGTIAKAQPRDEHLPVLFLEPHNPDVLGLDIAFDERRRRWIGEALVEPDLYVTPRYDLPFQRGRSIDAVAAYAPVFAIGGRARPANERGAHLRGIALTLFRIDRTIDSILERYPIAGMDLVLREEQPAEGTGLLFSSTGAFISARKSHGHVSTTARAANRRWVVELHGQGPLSSSVPFLVFGLGLMLSAMAAAGAWFLGRWRALHRAARLGQYVLTDKLGEGGMGAVYRARHELLRRPTAVKVIRDDYTHNEKAIARFEREVHAASELRHPNSIVVYDYGRTPDGTLYYAMELVPGYDLRLLVRRHGPLPPARVIHIARQICGALTEAHDHGLVHRDMKPANVMLCIQGTIHDFVKVLDFGLVLVRGAERELNEDTKMIGTPHFMAPEQFGEPSAVGPETDSYALGCVMHYLLTGKDLFERPTGYAVCLAHKNDRPLPMKMRTRRSIPEALEAIVMTCLSKAPADRPLARELDAMLTACEVPDTWGEMEAAAWWAQHPMVDEAPTSVRVSTRVLAVDFRGRDAVTRSD
jgi:eukaryotic-like serine/threonine-protein kinase